MIPKPQPGSGEMEVLVVMFKDEMAKLQQTETAKPSTKQTFGKATDTVLRLMVFWFMYLNLYVIGFAVVALTIIHGLGLNVTNWWWLIGGYSAVFVLLPFTKTTINAWFLTEGK